VKLVIGSKHGQYELTNRRYNVKCGYYNPDTYKKIIQYRTDQYVLNTNKIQDNKYKMCLKLHRHAMLN